MEEGFCNKFDLSKHGTNIKMLSLLLTSFIKCDSTPQCLILANSFIGVSFPNAPTRNNPLFIFHILSIEIMPLLKESLMQMLTKYYHIQTLRLVTVISITVIGDVPKKCT